MDCKVIYVFDLSLSKTFHWLLFRLSESIQMKLDGDLLWIGYCLREGFGKDDLRGGGRRCININKFVLQVWPGY